MLPQVSCAPRRNLPGEDPQFSLTPDGRNQVTQILSETPPHGIPTVTGTAESARFRRGSRLIVSTRRKHSILPPRSKMAAAMGWFSHDGENAGRRYIMGGIPGIPEGDMSGGCCIMGEGRTEVHIFSLMLWANFSISVT